MKIKIKCIISLLLLISVLPIGLAARASNDLEKECDNLIYEATYNRYYGRTIPNEEIPYMLGEPDKPNGKTIYKYKVFHMCNVINCESASFGGFKINNDEATNRYNMPTFALFLNNIEMFEELLKEFPNLRYLVDSAISKKKSYNGEFLTPALNAIAEGQYGILKYLIKKYDVNLLKEGGNIHVIIGYDHIIDAKKFAEDAVNKWKNAGNTKRLRCAQETKKVVEEWYAKHEHESKYVNEKIKYNEEIKKLAKEHPVVQIMPFEFTPSLDLFKPQNIEQNFAQNIDKQIDILIEKIMHDFDLSTFGNQI
ncbi:MAG: hypothetical protein J5594_03340 [Elusimicrobiaceae bacterium]|nr:hypothetical protein [Elusimicrobiaceae bacterium]